MVSLGVCVCVLVWMFHKNCTDAAKKSMNDRLPSLRCPITKDLPLVFPLSNTFYILLIRKALWRLSSTMMVYLAPKYTKIMISVFISSIYLQKKYFFLKRKRRLNTQRDNFASFRVLQTYCMSIFHWEMTHIKWLCSFAKEMTIFLDTLIGWSSRNCTRPWL